MMAIDVASIADPRVRFFYTMYWPQHRILLDFFVRLTEEQFDFRMVDSPTRRADSPRESLAHILGVQRMYLDGARTGRLEFGLPGAGPGSPLTGAQLLAALDCVDDELYAFLTGPEFAAAGKVQVPWGGEMDPLDVLYFLRDHDILHIGWNLALMDHLGMPRYTSLVQYWGP
jgi:uncharacterized damage-inducible protein DinB